MTELEPGEFSPLIENDSHSQVAGLFARVPDTRLIRGLLLPFGELSRPNVSGTAPVMFSAGTVKLPADPLAATLYNGHDHFSPIGRAVSLTETERGIEAEFAIAATEEGDAYLADPVRKLSAEIAPAGFGMALTPSPQSSPAPPSAKRAHSSRQAFSASLPPRPKRPSPRPKNFRRHRNPTRKRPLRTSKKRNPQWMQSFPRA